MRPEDVIAKAMEEGDQIIAALHDAGYRVVKQEQVGWLGPYGIVPGGMDNDAPEQARVRRGWKPVWRDAG